MGWETEMVRENEGQESFMGRSRGALRRHGRKRRHPHVLLIIIAKEEAR